MNIEAVEGKGPQRPAIFDPLGHGRPDLRGALGHAEHVEGGCPHSRVGAERVDDVGPEPLEPIRHRPSQAGVTAHGLRDLGAEVLHGLEDRGVEQGLGRSVVVADGGEVGTGRGHDVPGGGPRVPTTETS
jgi:hypothetical protein